MTADFSNGGWLGGFCACASVFLSLSSLFMFLLFSILRNSNIGRSSFCLCHQSCPHRREPLSVQLIRPVLQTLELPFKHQDPWGARRRGKRLRSVLNRAFALVLISIVMWFFFAFISFSILVRLCGSFSDLTFAHPREFLVYARMEYS